jgi:hypothetical protein
LDRFSLWKVEVVYFFSDNKTNSIGDEGSIATIVTLNEENLLPLTPMRIDAKESLTEGDKDCKVKNRI